MEKLQSDTLSPITSTTTNLLTTSTLSSSTSRFVKNPLLSPALTNMTIDDFTHNAVLLPAAMPIVSAPPPPPQQQQQQSSEFGEHHRSAIFAVGNSSGPATITPTPIVGDTDQFSEISLDQSNDFDIGYPPVSVEDNYQRTSGGSGEHQSALIQGTASTITALSQLPSVASNVLSSFSNILKGTTASATAELYQPIQQPSFTAEPSLQTNYPLYPQQSSSPSLSDIQNFENSSVNQQFYDYGQQQQQQQKQPLSEPAPPPRLYSPNDSSLLTNPSSALPQPPQTSSSNTYRLNAKRKIYAPLPGLATLTHSQEPIVANIPPLAPIPANLTPLAPTSANIPPLPIATTDPIAPPAPNQFIPSYQSEQANFQPQPFIQPPLSNFSQFQQEPPVQHVPPPQQPSSSKFSFSSLLSAAPTLVEKLQSQLVGPSPTSNQQQQHQQPFAPFEELTVGVSSIDYGHQSVKQSQPPQQQQQQPPNLINAALFNTKPIGQPTIPQPAPKTFLNPSLPPTPQPQQSFSTAATIPTVPKFDIFNPTAPSAPQLNSASSSQQPTPQPTPPPPTQLPFAENPYSSIPPELTRCVYPLQNQLPPPPSSSIPASVPPPGIVGTQASSYRLKGRPHYIAPTDCYTTTPVQPIVQQSSLQNFQNQTVDYFNPSIINPTNTNNTFIPSESTVTPNLSVFTEPPKSTINQSSIFNPLQIPDETPSEIINNPILHQEISTPFFIPTQNEFNSIVPQSVAPPPPPVQTYFEPQITETNNLIEPEVSPQQILTPPPSVSQLFTATNNNSLEFPPPPPPQQQQEQQSIDNLNIAFNNNLLIKEEKKYSQQQEPIDLNTRSTETSSSLNWFDSADLNANQPIINNNNQINVDNNKTINQPPSSQQDISNNFQIQNFFNNPPLLSDTQEIDQDRNFYETNLINKRLLRTVEHSSFSAANTTGTTGETETGSIWSNVVEPPSSAQSEFSETATDFSLSGAVIGGNSDQRYGDLFNTTDQTDNSDTINSNNVLPTNIDNTEIMSAFSNPPPPPTATTTTATATATTITGSSAANIVYRPVYKHWFYKKPSTTDSVKSTWTPFSMTDSLNLEEGLLTGMEIITTNGGRFDVNLTERCRQPIYWKAGSDEVRRCSWFYKGIDSRFVPYDEEMADRLEAEYKQASEQGEWNKKLPLTNGETIVFHGPSVMVHFLQAQSPDVWQANPAVPPTSGNRPRTVKRGTDEFNIEDGEPEQVDHLMFMVHGIGAGCDLKFRSVEEVVEEFRATSLQLVQSHYRSSCDRGDVGRIEILPIEWHSDLHSEESGIDEKLKNITLESIPKLRTFTNDTLLDILFYTSPVFCQRIVDAVGGSINELYTKFKERNPTFTGEVSLTGHSLGSLIIFDLLQNQKNNQMEKMDIGDNDNNDDDSSTGQIRNHMPLKRTRSQKINYTMGHAGTGQPFIKYPQLLFKPKKFFAMGSPIGMFVTVRGIDALGLNYKLPTTEGFYNIFHPYDPVAYRIEALVNSELATLRPVLIPHHKGRKRMHLELRETMTRVGNDIKQKIVDTFKTTMNTVYSFSLLSAGKNDPRTIQHEVDKVLEQQLTLETVNNSMQSCDRTRTNSTSTTSSDLDNGDTDLPLGNLNNGKRVDYVLQEAPLEFFNEYLFALTSHVGYWESADTTLFIVKEIYSSMGIQTDSQIPQHNMTIERPSPINSPSTQKNAAN